MAYTTSNFLEQQDPDNHVEHVIYYSVAPIKHSYSHNKPSLANSTSLRSSVTQASSPDRCSTSDATPCSTVPISSPPSYLENVASRRSVSRVTSADNVSVEPQHSISQAGRAQSELDLTSPHINDLISSVPVTPAEAISPLPRNLTLPALDDVVYSAPVTPTESTSNPLRNPPPLALPIAIPQAVHGRGQPFVRVWAPALEAQGISQTDFLGFLDGLNLVGSASLPLQALQAGGAVIGFLPFGWAQIANLAIDASAGAGIAAVSKTRVFRYLKRANAQMFAPRGLQCRIVGYGRIRGILRIPASRPLVLPATHDTMGSTGRQRMLAAVMPFSSPITAHVHAPAKPASALARLTARQLAFKQQRRDEKLAAQRKKNMAKQQKGQMFNDPSHSKEVDEAMKLKWIIIEPLKTAS